MITNQTALISENEQDVIDANLQIMSNSGIPTENGKTTNWCDVKQAYEQSFYYIIKPPIDGWTPDDGENVSQETMMQGVTNVTEELFNTDWNPPLSPPGE